MTYTSTDPRSQLTTTGPTSTNPDDALAPQYLDFHQMTPSVVHENGGRSWIVRAANVVLAYTELLDGDSIERNDADETMLVLLPSAGRATVTVGQQESTVSATAIITVAPGPWSCSADGPVRMIRIHPLSAGDLLEHAANADAYARGLGNAAVTSPWPAPRGDQAIRVYGSIEDVEPAQGRLGRIYRGRHVMINALYPRRGPRDPRTLSPHTHDDFEQLSFVDEGRYVHHIRREWGTDRTRWTPDEHREIGGPSVTIIPPPLVHTSEAVGEGENRMFDVFAGPRADFSARPGWVLNAQDYPAPNLGAEA